MLAVYISTTNDTSGNPRRGWIIFDDTGHSSTFIDEGYLGKAALAQGGFPTIARTYTRINVTPGEYRSWMKVRKNKRGSRRAKRTSRRNKRTSRRAR